MPNSLDLMQMLRWKRPAGSEREDKFVRTYIDPVPGMEADNYGNRWLIHKTSRTLISVHTDTVHRNSGMQQVVANALGVVSVAESCKQQVRDEPTIAELLRGMGLGGGKKIHGPKSRRVYVDDETKSHCLGADDTAGVYAALRMIEAKVPVSFVFHRDEETGGRGSSWVAGLYEDWLSETFDRCVALDRRGTKDVIISQWGDQCCSLEFAFALCGALGMGHSPAAGVFTDSANYMHLIPECSNISIGYMNEHSPGETLDTRYLEELIGRLCAVEWDKLPTVRDPNDTWTPNSTMVSAGGGMARSDGWGDGWMEGCMAKDMMDMGMEEEMTEEEWERAMLEEELEEKERKG